MRDAFLKGDDSWNEPDDEHGFRMGAFVTRSERTIREALCTPNASRHGPRAMGHDLTPRDDHGFV